MAESIVGRKEWPSKIKAGRVTMFVGCILFFINALLELGAFVLDLVMAPVLKNIPEYADLAMLIEQRLWSDPIAIIQTFSLPVIAAFLIISGIGGISWLKDKGPFISIAPLMAMLSLVILIVNMFLDIRRLIISNWDWLEFLLNFIDLQLTCGIFFIGWSIAKNQID